MKITGKRCFFHELKPGEMFSNNDEAFYDLANEKEEGLGIFIRSDKPTPTDAEPNGYQIRNAMVYRLKIGKPIKKTKAKKKVVYEGEDHE